MIDAIVVDIEGTISSINFVKEVLFPYARERTGDYLNLNSNTQHVQDIWHQVEDISGKKLSLEELSSTLVQWIDEDKKATPLKILQGYIWEEGFQSGAFRAHMYPDALEKLESWKKDGIPLYIYSSGSVKAQKLFFAHTEYGDLLDLFSGYFDTEIGGKKESISYIRIAESIKVAPSHIAFFSDIEEELNAAAEAGYNTYLIDRGKLFTDSSHKIFTDFTKVMLKKGYC